MASLSGDGELLLRLGPGWFFAGAACVAVIGDRKAGGGGSRECLGRAVVAVMEFKL